MTKLSVLLLVLGVPAVLANDTVTVFQLAGVIQCLPGTGVSVERAADLLRAQGVKVVAAERRAIPVDVGRHCGAPTLDANVIQVAAADWTTFLAQNADAGGYGLWVFDAPTVEVFKHDGTVQCGTRAAIPLGEMEKELLAAGVAVSARRKADDGLAHIAVCGASTGNINVFEILRKDLPAAEQLGFSLLISRELTQRIKPRPQSMPSPTPRPPNDAPGGNHAAEGPVPLLW